MAGACAWFLDAAAALFYVLPFIVYTIGAARFTPVRNVELVCIMSIVSRSLAVELHLLCSSPGVAFSVTVCQQPRAYTALP